MRRSNIATRIGQLAAIFTTIAAQNAYAEWVLPPGQEAALEAALGGAPVAGCQLLGAKIDKSQVVASYTCGAEVRTLTLRHSSQAAGSGVAAGTLWISPEGVLASELAARLNASAAAAVRWKDVQPTQGHDLPAPATTTGRGVVPPLPPELERRYRATDAAMRGDQPWEMFDEVLALVRISPHPVLMGRLVVACAGTASHPDGRAKVDALMADAKANPDDALKQFIAGVAVHYRGHVRGASRAQKLEEYRLALSFLEPIREVYADSPRLWIYLAVSYVRTGQQEKAEEAIAKALEFDEKTDADVYYCEAEVWHKKDPKRALAAIERYQQLMREQAPTGAWHGPGKAEKVEHMRQVMAKVVAGEPLPAEDMYDPVLQQGGRRAQGLLADWLPIALGGIVVAAVGLWIACKRPKAMT